MNACDWTLFDAVWIGIAVLAIASIRHQRRQHDAELLERRTRLYQGSELA